MHDPDPTALLRGQSTERSQRLLQGVKRRQLLERELQRLERHAYTRRHRGVAWILLGTLAGTGAWLLAKFWASALAGELVLTPDRLLGQGFLTTLVASFPFFVVREFIAQRRLPFRRALLEELLERGPGLPDR